MYPDEYIDYWGDKFVAEGLRRKLGITFEQFLEGFKRRRLGTVQEARAHHAERLKFLKRRAEHLAATTDRAAIADFADLLPAQQRIAEREVEGLPRRNGAPVEKLAHHRYPKSVAHFGVHQEKHQ